VDRSRALRLVGALLVLAGGAVHLKLSLEDYGNDAIVRAFALNAGVSALAAAWLVLRDDVLGPLAGIGVSLGTLVAFALSRQGDGLLDLREVGITNPAPDAVLTLVAEGLALVVLVLAVLVRPRRGWLAAGHR
jgi:hypothetical protein